MKNDFSLFIEINLILIIFAAIFFQGASAEIDWYPIGMWIVVVFCLSFFGWQKGWINSPKLTGLEPLLLIWLLVLIFSGIASSHQMPAIFFFERLIVSLLFFYLMVWHFQRKDREKILLWSLFAFPVLLSISGIASYFTQTPLFFPFTENKDFVSATIFNPNNYAGLTNLCLFLGFGLVMGLRRLRSKIKGEAASRTTIFAFPVLVLLIALGLSLSRAGWISFYIAGLGLMLWLGIQSESKRFRNYIILVLAVLTLGTFMTVFMDKIPVLKEFYSIFNEFMRPHEEVTISGRLQYAKTSISMFRSHPWLGIGPGAYWIEYPAYRISEAALAVRHAHGDFWELLSETGIFSAVLFLAIMVQSFRIWFKRYKREMDQFERRVSIGIVFGILALLVHDLVDFHFHIPGVVYYLMALCAFLVKPRQSRKEFKPIWGLGQVMVILILPLALALGSIQWVSALQFRQGMKFFKKQQWLYAMDAFKKSSKIIKFNPEPFYWMAQTNLRLMASRNDDTRISMLGQSEQDLIKAVSIEKRYPYYWSLLGSVSELLKVYGRKPIKAPDYCFREALALDPNQPLFLELLTKYLIRNNQPDEAKLLIPKLAKIQPASALVISQVWLTNGNSAEDLVSLYGDNITALTLLAGKLNADEKYRALALAAAQKAFALDPQNQAASNLLSQMAAVFKDCEIIKQSANKQNLEESISQIYAICLMNSGQLDRAIEEYLNLITIKPEVAQYHLELSRIYLRKNDPDHAQEQLLWIADRPDKATDAILIETYLSLARISEKQKQFDSALKYYRLYLEERPEDLAIRGQIEKIENRGKVEMIHSPWDIKDDSK